jgi:hypothetical protein
VGSSIFLLPQYKHTRLVENKHFAVFAARENFAQIAKLKTIFVSHSTAGRVCDTRLTDT